MTNEVFKCSKCGKTKKRKEFYERMGPGRPVFYHCIECRKERDRRSEAWLNAKKHHSTICPSCGWPKKIMKDAKTCDDCLVDYGIKRCSSCKELMLKDIAFSPMSNLCNSCSNPLLEDSSKVTNISKQEITYPDFLAMFSAQNNKCYLCENQIDPKSTVISDSNEGVKIICPMCAVAVSIIKGVHRFNSFI